jgi:hypothetical protein
VILCRLESICLLLTEKGRTFFAGVRSLRTPDAKSSTQGCGYHVPSGAGRQDSPVLRSGQLEQGQPLLTDTRGAEEEDLGQPDSNTSEPRKDLDSGKSAHEAKDIFQDVSPLRGGDAGDEDAGTSTTASTDKELGPRRARGRTSHDAVSGDKAHSALQHVANEASNTSTGKSKAASRAGMTPSRGPMLFSNRTKAVPSAHDMHPRAGADERMRGSGELGGDGLGPLVPRKLRATVMSNRPDSRPLPPQVDAYESDAVPARRVATYRKPGQREGDLSTPSTMRPTTAARVRRPRSDRAYDKDAYLSKADVEYQVQKEAFESELLRFVAGDESEWT